MSIIQREYLTFINEVLRPLLTEERLGQIAESIRNEHEYYFEYDEMCLVFSYLDDEYKYTKELSIFMEYDEYGCANRKKIEYCDSNIHRELILVLVSKLKEFKLDNPKNKKTLNFKVEVGLDLQSMKAIQKFFEEQPKTLKDLIFENLPYPDRLVKLMSVINKTINNK